MARRAALAPKANGNACLYCYTIRMRSVRACTKHQRLRHFQTTPPSPLSIVSHRARHSNTVLARFGMYARWNRVLYPYLSMHTRSQHRVLSLKVSVSVRIILPASHWMRAPSIDTNTHTACPTGVCNHQYHSIRYFSALSFVCFGMKRWICRHRMCHHIIKRAFNAEGGSVESDTYAHYLGRRNISVYRLPSTVILWAPKHRIESQTPSQVIKSDNAEACANFFH